MPNTLEHSRVSANPRRGKHKLPTPVGCRVGIFPFQCGRQSHVAETFCQIALMLAAHVAEMRRQARLHASGEHRTQRTGGELDQPGPTASSGFGKLNRPCFSNRLSPNCPPQLEKRAPQAGLELTDQQARRLRARVSAASRLSKSSGVISIKGWQKNHRAAECCTKVRPRLSAGFATAAARVMSRVVMIGIWTRRLSDWCLSRVRPLFWRFSAPTMRITPGQRAAPPHCR